MVRKVTIPYTAACSSVILPTVLFLVIFFGIWLGIPIWLSWQQGWTIPEWLPLVTLLLGVVAGLGVAVALYPFCRRTGPHPSRGTVGLRVPFRRPAGAGVLLCPAGLPLAQP